MKSKKQLLTEIDKVLNPRRGKYLIRLFLTDWLQEDAHYYRSAYSDKAAEDGELFTNWQGYYDYIFPYVHECELFVEDPPPTAEKKIRMYPTGSEPPEPGE